MIAREFLLPCEYLLARDVGDKRDAATWNQPHASYYAESNVNRLPEREGHFRGALGEIATAKFLNLYWNANVWPYVFRDKEEKELYKAIPDVGRNVEVKTTLTEDGDLYVPDTMLGRGMFIVLAYPEPPDFRAVTLLGWYGYDAAFDKGAPTKSGRARRFPQSALNGMETARKIKAEKWAGD